MFNLNIILLKAFRKVYFLFFSKKNNIYSERIDNPNLASDLIFKQLVSDKPCMIARFGSTELACLSNYIGVKEQQGQYVDYILGKTNPWWWEKNIIAQMQNCGGFFPPTIEQIEKYCELFCQDIKSVDILGSWLPNEKHVDSLLNCSKVHLRLLEPFWSEIPWTKVLEGKNILVVHPFAETIKYQYSRRKQMFQSEILPTFNLKVIKAVQTIANNKSDFKDWFEALDFMKGEIDKVDYDICLIGCGAYGFHLAAHVKRMGKKAVHLGGSLQLLFGIRGKRWENPMYGVREWGIPYASYLSLINNNWVRPSEEETPKNTKIVENSCYW